MHAKLQEKTATFTFAIALVFLTSFNIFFHHYRQTKMISGQFSSKIFCSIYNSVLWHWASGRWCGL